MNDDQIRSELERRAGSTPTQPDWAKRVLLPAVWREVDARPQPVVTSRWSAGVSVAALVTALLVLVVAVPRLTPQPPTSSGSPDASPTASPYRVMSSGEFFEGWKSGELRGRTVLVEGSIGESLTTMDGRPPCDPPNPCPWGSLLGIDPGLAVYARQFAVPTGGEGLEVDAWAWHNWSLPQVPVSGILVMSVQDDGLAVFQGLVRPPATGLERTLVDAAALDISTFSPSDVAIVRGHLFNPYPRDAVRFCPVQTSPDLVGLPSRFCANQDYLSDEIWGAPDLPRGAFMDVQAGAADDFGGDEEALYAISPRLYGGGCEGGPAPCWFWDVLARVDGPPDSPDPSPTPAQPDSRVVACDLVKPVVIDETGLVTHCPGSTTPQADGAPLTISNVDGNQSLLIVSWAYACGGIDELILRTAASGYELTASMLDSGYVLDRGIVVCDALPVETRVLLTLSAPIAADTVTVRYFAHPPEPNSSPTPSAGLSNVGTDRAEVAGAAFDLSISADRVEYQAGDAIDVSSSLRSETDVTVSCLWQPLISLEQLDGDLEFSPGPFILMCPGAKELEGGQIFTTGFLPAVWGVAAPNPLDPYVRDGKLYLPPGTYRFTAGSSLNVGDIGSENRVRLEASIVIHVR